MSRSTAAAYADSIAQQIIDDTEAGHPFGISTEDEPILDREEGEEGSAMDYLDSALDIHYTVTGDRTYRSARICVAWGGPNAWINTGTGQLEVSWYSEPVFRDLPSEFINGLDDAVSELWDMGA